MQMENDTTGKMMTLKSNDGVHFVVTEAVAMQSQVIRLLFGNNYTGDPIPLPNVSAKILAKVIEYCEHQIGVNEETVDVPASPEQGKGSKDVDTGNRKNNQFKLSDWEEQFFDVDQDTVIALLTAADYLYVDKMLESACQKVADMISAKTVEEVRETFDIENDITPEEEGEVRREYSI